MATNGKISSSRKQWIFSGVRLDRHSLTTEESVHEMIVKKVLAIEPPYFN